MIKSLIIALIVMSTFCDGVAQLDSITLAQKFAAYQENWPRPRIHLVFNQHKFLPGETVFFKAYLLNENLVGMKGKQLINVDLVDAEGKSHLHFKFNVDQGLGHNQFVIPDTLPAGVYLVTAYSNWMRNFDDIIFKDEIIVVKKNEVIALEKHELKVAVEGGHLIRDISTKLAIRSSFVGNIVHLVDASGNEIFKTQLDSLGMGQMIFTPKLNQLYFIQTVQAQFRKELPKVEADGIQLCFKGMRKLDVAEILVTCPDESAYRNKRVKLVVSAKGKIYLVKNIVAEAEEFKTLLIPLDSMPPGIINLSILSATGDLLASREIYNPEKNQVKAVTASEKAEYHPRDLVNLEITIKDHNGMPAEGEFSVCVLNNNFLDEINRKGFVDELSVFNGNDNAFVLERENKHWLSLINNLLITMNTPVPWLDMLAIKQPKPQFPFMSLLEKKGKVYLANTNEFLPDKSIVQFYLQQSGWRYQTTVAENGGFQITIPDIYGFDEFFLIAESKSGKRLSNLKIEWDEGTPVTLPKAPASRETETPDAYSSFMSKVLMINQSYDFYLPEDTTMHESDASNRRDFAADLVVNISDYIFLPSMEEFIKEVIPSMFHRKKGDRDIVRVNLPLPMPSPVDDPLYIIDGFATVNTAYFLSLKPIDLVRIKIITDPLKLTRFGLLGKNGIVVVESKEGGMRDTLDDPSKIVLGLRKPIPFRPINASSTNPYKPNFKSTVYWEPVIQTNKNGKATVAFNATDDIGLLNVYIEGITKEGQPFSKVSEISVVPDK